MNSRESILHQLRRQFVPSAELPSVLCQNWTEYEDPVSKFAEMVAFAGGDCEMVDTVEEVLGSLRSAAEFQSAGQVLSLVAGVSGNVDLNDIEKPHDLRDLDYVICQAHLAVAENGAVWLTDQDIRHRVCIFITQFLVVLVQAKTIVHHMHQAYDQVRQATVGFGLFLAGPSKTADIEQSLVIGAHGCRRLQVFILQKEF